MKSAVPERHSDSPVRLPIPTGASRRLLVSTVGVCLIVGIAIGLTVGLLVAPSPVPGEVAVATGEPVIDLAPQPFVDQVSVPAAASLTPEETMSSAAAGVVVATRCQPGVTVNSGKAVLTVDNRVVIALHLAAPLWRDLAVGDKGPDVADLQKELTRLGYPVKNDGVYGRIMADQVKRLWASVGAGKLTSVPLGQVMWMPDASVTPSSCAQKPGDVRTGGEPVLTSGGQLTGLSLSLPDGIWPGARLATLNDGTSANISDDGTVTDTDFLKAYTRTRGYIQWLADSTNPLMVTTVLATPFKVVSVPPAALYGVDGRNACLADGSSNPVAVQIVASQLGETFVTSSNLPTHVMVPPPENAPSCR